MTRRDWSHVVVAVCFMLGLTGAWVGGQGWLLAAAGFCGIVAVQRWAAR